MPDQDDSQFRRELEARALELKRRTFEEESRRIAREAEARAQEATKARLAEDSQTYSRKLGEAQEERQRKETELKKQEEEVLRKLRREAEKKIEARMRQEEDQKRKVEDEKRRVEEAEKRRKDEERKAAEDKERARREEERRRILEVERKKADAEKARRDAELKRKDDERRRKDEEAREAAKEREDRIQTLMVGAKVYFDDGDFEHASVEVAKALVNDPANPEALELERLIKEAQGKKTGGADGADKPRKKERTLKGGGVPITGRKKPYGSALMVAAVIAIIIVSILVILELRKSTSTGTFTIAVLPWTSPSDVAEEKIMGSSLAEEAAASLREYKSAFVMDFSSAYRLAHHTVEPDQAAYQLGFRYALEGMIARSAAGYTVNVKLIDSTRNPVWSHTFEARDENLSALADEIAGQLVASFGSGMAEKTGGTSVQKMAVVPGAYLAYLQAKELLKRGTPESSLNAIALLRQATQQDGKFADAFAAAGCALAARAERGWDAGDSTLSQARAFAEDAIAIDPSTAEAYRVLGVVFSLRKEYRSALSEFDTAARYTPKSGSILLSRATVLLKVGKYPDAIAALGRAYELSPRDPELLHTFAVAHQLSGSIHSGSGYHLAAIEVADDSAAYLIGPFADAVVLDAELSVQSDRVASACRQRLKRQPDDYETMYRLSRLLQVTGKPLDALELLGKAETILRAAVQRDPRNARAMLYLALTLTRQGKFPEAAALAVKAAAIDKRNPEVKYMMAQMYSLQMYSQREKKIDENTKEAALKALREAIEGSYRFDEIASADFYNLFERPEFRTAIQQAL